MNANTKLAEVGDIVVTKFVDINKQDIIEKAEVINSQIGDDGYFFYDFKVVEGKELGLVWRGKSYNIVKSGN